MPPEFVGPRSAKHSQNRALSGSANLYLHIIFGVRNDGLVGMALFLVTPHDRKRSEKDLFHGSLLAGFHSLLNRLTY